MSGNSPFCLILHFPAVIKADWEVTRELPGHGSSAICEIWFMLTYTSLLSDFSVVTNIEGKKYTFWPKKHFPAALHVSRNVSLVYLIWLGLFFCCLVVGFFSLNLSKAFSK